MLDMQTISLNGRRCMYIIL